MLAHLSLAVVLLLFPVPRDPEPDDKGKGFFGVLLVDNIGATITRVEPGSPADKGGIRLNDAILSIDGQRVPTVTEAREIIARLRPGTIVPVEVRRGDKPLTIKIKVGARPTDL